MITRLAILGCALLASGSVARAQSYPLVCRSGSGMTLSVGIFNGRNTATVFFNPSSRPASAGLAPGSCGWTDRGWRQGEPTNLSIRDAGRVVGSFVNGSYSRVEFTRGDIRFLEAITRNGNQTFVFQVHREGFGGNGTMVVDRVGP
jgi:hypothetical protein